MHLKGFCLEEYIEYLAEHPHIEVYEDGKLKYGIFRQENVLADTSIRIPEAAKAYTVSADNMGGLICALSY